MKKFVSAVVAAAAAISFATFTAPAYAEKPAWANKGDDDIVTFALAAADKNSMPLNFDADGTDYDVLVAALVLTEVVGIFDGTDYTVFAPTDQAFYDLTNTSDDAAAVAALAGLIGLDGIAAVLSYHVTEGVRNSRSVTRARSVTMLDGNTISGRSGMIEAVGSTAEIVDGGADIRLADGIVHVIDTVLLPTEAE